MTIFNATLYNNLTITKKLIRYHINHKHKRSYHSSFIGPNYNHMIQKVHYYNPFVGLNYNHL